MRSRPNLLALGAALAVSLAGCDSEPAPVGGPAPPARSPALGAVPELALAELEPAVADQLAQRRRRVEKLLADSGTPSLTLGRAFGDLGRVFHAYEYTDAAAACYDNAARLAPKDFEWWYYLGRVRQEQGDFEGAASALREALRLRMNDIPTHISLASVARQLGDDAEAKRLVGRVLELDPRNAAALFVRGQIASRRGDHAAAAADYERALALQPWASNVHYSLAVAYQRLGSDELARHHLEQRGPRKPSLEDPLMTHLRTLTTGVGAHLVRGSQAMQARNLQLAVLEFSKAAEADPNNPTARLNLGAALAQGGRLDEAAVHFRAALQLDLSSVSRSKVYFNLAILEQMAGKTERAIEDFREAARWDPANVEARRRLEALEAGATGR